MDRSEVELPDRVASRIDTPDSNRSITQYQVAKEFAKRNRPYYNVSRMHAALGRNVSTDTIQSRMDELVEKDVLKSEKVNNGYIYWLKHEKSDWPIAPDVEVEPKRTELTVSEWKTKDHVRLGALSLFLTTIGTAVTLFGTFQAGGYYVTSLEVSQILAVGLSAGLISYFGLFLAILLWLFDVDEITDIQVS